MSSSNTHIAHIRSSDGAKQSLEAHLIGVSKLAAQSAKKIDLEKAGELLGLLHDIGKYSNNFQEYILSAGGLSDQDSDDYVSDASRMKGKIDHSTAGSQWVWNTLSCKNNPLRTYMAQMFALALASHHSGLIDCLSLCGIDIFSTRMVKPDGKTHFSEVRSKLPSELERRICELLRDEELETDFGNRFLSLRTFEERIPAKKDMRFFFKAGLLLRMLFSCLIDADRTDSIDFEKKGASIIRQKGNYTSWATLVERLELHLEKIKSDDAIGRGRRSVSDDCKAAAGREKGIFTLTVPTGGGKTLASLRFALHHALKYQITSRQIDHIFYIIPYTSIIDQNAQVAREILETEEDCGRIVLECHSNLTEEQDTWRNKLLSENWDAPIVFTTNVQLLETLFGGGTRSVRRMHQLANSIIIFDEIQTLPVRTVHLFCNAINFLVEQCSASVVLCSATQPLLNGVDETLGALSYTKNDEIVSNVSGLFGVFRRVEVVDRTRPGGYSNEEVAELALEEQKEFGTCLVILNTTKAARNVYQSVKKSFGNTVHLSANMCPAHRMEVLERIRVCLAENPQTPLICISTQVIEAGVDVDFGAVIRSMAGLDSIAQAAGRCNRHGYRVLGRVSIINPTEENVDKLVDIKKGRDVTRIILDDLREPFGESLLSPKAIEQYFRYYFYDRAEEMLYAVKDPRDDTLLNMLSNNGYAVYDNNRNPEPSSIPLKQSFASAAAAFRAIDAPTKGIIVPYEEGGNIIAQLCGKIDLPKKAAILRRAQRFSVNIYENVFKDLQKRGLVYKIGAQSDFESLGVWALRKEGYSSEFGVSLETIHESRAFNM